jgi:hypothetical protein
MVMHDAPFAAALGYQHCVARWKRHRLSLLHPGKFVKAGKQHGVVVNRDAVTFLCSVLVAAVF